MTRDPTRTPDDPDSTTESEASVDVDEDDEANRPGSLENTNPPPRESDGDDHDGDETVPAVELDLYDLSVRVSGQSTDDLDAVEGAARELMDFLVDRARTLEDRPDDRGLS
ncbi:hypothetical protein [Salinigranum salinum]|uniref:hypothetical protein n=1 Tax=Salinigranum salinum TaxID=1364937 RepID=UPI0012608591|nr:hypothetical protein [Salinigranum salinum]